MKGVTVRPSDTRIRIATQLHDLFCHYNHTDQCGWFYEKWEQPGWTMRRYLAQADFLRGRTNELTLIRILDHLAHAKQIQADRTET